MALKNVISTIDADVKKSKSFADKVRVVKNDDIRFIVNMLDNDKPFTEGQMAQIATATLVNLRRDAVPVPIIGEILSGNQIIFDISRQVTAALGRVRAMVQLYDVDGHRISSLSFTYEVVADLSDVNEDQFLEKEQTLIEVVLGDGPLVIEQAIQATEYANIAADYVDDKIPLIDKFTGDQSNLQAQVDQLVVDGESSPESAQARVGADATTYSSLKTRLDAEQNKVNQQLADTAINVKSFGAKGDGVTDDSTAIQNAIDYASKKGYGKVFVPPTNTGYVIDSQSIKIPDNINLNGDNTTIINNQMISGAEGIFEVKGVAETSVYKLTSDALIGSMELSFSDASHFQEGDFIKVHQIGGTLNEDKYHMSFVEIDSVDKSNNKILLTSPLKHTYKISLNAYVQKVNSVKNTKISGFNFKSNHVEQLDSIKVRYAVSTELKQINGIGFGGTLIAIDTSMYFNIDDVTGRKASNTTEGRGYAVKVHNGSSFGSIHQIRGIRVRHCVDIAGGSHTIDVNNSLGVKTAFSAFGLHGMNEKDVKFNQCVAMSCGEGFTPGNSTYGRSGNAIFTNCTAYDCSNWGFNIAESDNIKMDNCKAERCNFQIILSGNVQIDNCNVNEGFFSVQRSSDVVVTNTHVNSTTAGGAWNIFYNCSDVTLMGCTSEGGTYGFRIGETETTRTTNRIKLDNCKAKNAVEYDLIIHNSVTDVTINGCDAENVIVFATAINSSIQDTRIRKNVDLRPTTNFIFKDNYGYWTKILPASSGTLVVEGNIKFS